MIKWTIISNTASLDDLLNQSAGNLVIFKHSERCSVSRMAKKEFENDWKPQTSVCLVNVIEARDVSNLIASQFSVTHQSPQLLVIKNGHCVYNASHHHIHADDAAKHLS